jgi:glycosyltransferase involved in cell wall biosynthesis
MIRIAYYTDQVYLHGGIERVLANKINYLTATDDFEVYLITSEQRENKFCYDMDERLIHHDLGINYDRKLSYYHPKNIKKVPRHYLALRTKLKEIKPHIVVVCNFSFDYYFIPFMPKDIVKIKEYHSSRYFENLKRKAIKSIFGKLFHKFNDYIELKYDYLAVLTESEKQYYKSNNTVVIPNGLTNFPTNASKLTEKQAISAGRINTVKQFDKLIMAWKDVVKNHPDWKLNIYGDGDALYIGYLQKMIDDYGINKQVELLGTTSNLESKMLDSSFYVMSSSTECFPMVLLEAMSCGLPVISFDCPHGPSNIITNNVDGILVDPDNTQQLANVITLLINNDNDLKNKGKMARENIKRFDQKIIMEKWIELFKKAAI